MTKMQMLQQIMSILSMSQGCEVMAFKNFDVAKKFVTGIDEEKSVVVSKETLMPSNGFYKLAEELGSGNWQTLKEKYWGIEEMNRAFKFWQNSKK